eukprot:scaffold2044_cov202-Prasinococcus_capsulatus_cf.AAC.10
MRACPHGLVHARCCAAALGRPGARGGGAALDPIPLVRFLDLLAPHKEGVRQRAHEREALRAMLSSVFRSVPALFRKPTLS